MVGNAYDITRLRAAVWILRGHRSEKGGKVKGRGVPDDIVVESNIAIARPCPYCESHPVIFLLYGGPMKCCGCKNPNCKVNPNWGHWPNSTRESTIAGWDEMVLEIERKLDM